MFRGKKYKKVAESFDRTQAFALEQALEILKKSEVKFDQTVELHFNLGVDPKNSDQAVRGTVVLPNGTGRQVRVLVFCKDNNFQAAKDAGADYVGGADLVQKIQEGWLDFDAVVATPDMMPVISKVARVLGPRGLMPNPKSGTVTMDVAKAVKEVKQGKIDFKVDKTGIVHSSIGKVSFTSEQIYQNAKEFIQTIIKLKPTAAKGTYIKSIFMSSTMSKGIKIDPKSVE